MQAQRQFVYISAFVVTLILILILNLILLRQNGKLYSCTVVQFSQNGIVFSFLNLNGHHVIWYRWNWWKILQAIEYCYGNLQSFQTVQFSVNVTFWFYSYFFTLFYFWFIWFVFPWYWQFLLRWEIKWKVN